MTLKHFKASNEKEKSFFYYELVTVLEKYNLNIDLQSIGISSQKLSDYKGGRSTPSLKVLRKLFKELRTAVPYHDLFPLLLLGLGLDGIAADAEFWGVLGSQPLWLERSQKVRNDLKTRCVISERLGESFRDVILANTLEQITQSATEYFYFIPEGTGEQDDVLRRVSARHERSILERFRQQAYFITSPGCMFLTRCVVDNIRETTQRVFHSIGPYDYPSLIDAQAPEASKIVNIIYPVVAKVRLERAEGRSTIEVHNRADDMDLTFRLEEN